MAGHVDLDELDRWMPIGWERRRGADIPYRLTSSAHHHESYGESRQARKYTSPNISSRSAALVLPGQVI